MNWESVFLNGSPLAVSLVTILLILYRVGQVLEKKDATHATQVEAIETHHAAQQKAHDEAFTSAIQTVTQAFREVGTAQVSAFRDVSTSQATAFRESVEAIAKEQRFDSQEKAQLFKDTLEKVISIMQKSLESGANINEQVMNALQKQRKITNEKP
jgi:translation initiation factor 2 beta subunit (eIF-2beta)/eIF-5